MVTPSASRFAILPMDDDGDTSRRISIKGLNKKKDEQPKPQNNAGSKKCDTKKKQNIRKKPDQPASAKQKPKPKLESNKKKNAQDQWEQWKQRDAEFVDGHYEDELQQAMMLSKLDYEENKELYEQIKKANKEEKRSATKKNKKSNKAQPMSLSQFNQLGEIGNQPDESSLASGGGVTNGNQTQEADPEFFERIKTEAKKAIQSEKAEEERKAREPMIDELISIAQYKDKLDKCKEEINRLRKKNEKLQNELKNVKTRNGKLCELLLQGEMKDKAAVLEEVGDLQQVKIELSKEVERLVAELEQEKSKVRALSGSDTKNKEKNKKRTDSK